MHFGDIDLFMQTSFFILHAVTLQRGEIIQPVTLLMNQPYLETSHSLTYT